MTIKSSRLLIALMFVALSAGVFAYASEMDERIESSAKNSYVFKTYLKDDSINVESKDGIVTLKGTVTEDSHKSLAKDTVANLPGVKKVHNELVLKMVSPSKDSDAWIGLKVKTVLMYHRHVNGFKTDVDVKDGVVTLRGEARSQAQKELTGDYAGDVSGVKSVNNEMTVAGNQPNMEETVKEDIDDASITAQIMIELVTHRSTSAIQTGVKTKNGVVTLYGKAKNDAERELVEKLANDVKGVSKVINKMTVEK